MVITYRYVNAAGATATTADHVQKAAPKLNSFIIG
jgi:hypothetical protein